MRKLRKRWDGVRAESENSLNWRGSSGSWTSGIVLRLPQTFLSKLAGDIGGVFVKKTDRLKRIEERESNVANTQDEWTTENEECFNEVRRRWLGITEEHYLACAEKANPGVIVLALGAGKAKTAIACVERGLVNMLVIDLDLAKTICHLLKGESEKRCTLSNCPFAEIMAVNDANFDGLVLQSAAPVLVVFHHEKEGKFSTLVPSLALFASYARNKNAEVDVAQFNVDEGFDLGRWAGAYATDIATSLDQIGYSLALFRNREVDCCYGPSAVPGRKELNDWLADVADVLAAVQQASDRRQPS